ncbi:extensin-like [Nilaparvata lugens]|uniref:extensin-like n=1 Tax=Nilaparvata lugens TaxID=108931 RepID=UPI00193D9687|nr:extensin-like [Nilaparvata lugens]
MGKQRAVEQRLAESGWMWMDIWYSATDSIQLTISMQVARAHQGWLRAINGVITIQWGHHSDDGPCLSHYEPPHRNNPGVGTFVNQLLTPPPPPTIQPPSPVTPTPPPAMQPLPPAIQPPPPSPHYRRQPSNHCHQPSNHRRQSPYYRCQPSNHRRQPSNHCRQSPDYRHQPSNHRCQPSNHRRQPSNQRRQPSNQHRQSLHHRCQPSNHRHQSPHHSRHPIIQTSTRNWLIPRVPTPPTPLENWELTNSEENLRNWGLLNSSQNQTPTPASPSHELESLARIELWENEEEIVDPQVYNAVEPEDDLPPPYNPEWGAAFRQQQAGSPPPAEEILDYELDEEDRLDEAAGTSVETPCPPPEEIS